MIKPILSNKELDAVITLVTPEYLLTTPKSTFKLSEYKTELFTEKKYWNIIEIEDYYDSFTQKWYSKFYNRWIPN